jgi:hypothetical protein
VIASASSARSRLRNTSGLWRTVLACVLAVGVAGLAGCGGSSKPKYCTARSDLQTSIKGLTSLSATSGVSGLQAQVTKIENDITTLVNSAKSDFPTETAAMKSSLDTLTSSVQSLGSSPSAGQIATVATNAASVVSSATAFINASSAKCK